jgi:glutaredoxin 3
MAEVTLYTTMLCPYCHRAKALLKKKGVSFMEIDVSGDPDKRSEMVSRSGGRQTVPQIFIDGRHVGGSEELAVLDQKGELDRLLAG